MVESVLICEAKFTFDSLQRAYRFACRGNDCSTKIELSVTLVNEFMNRIFDEKTIERAAKVYNKTIEEYLVAVRKNEIPLKFMTSDLIVNDQLNNNEAIIFGSFGNVNLTFNTIT